jgi:hypothetical protein
MESDSHQLRATTPCLLIPRGMGLGKKNDGISTHVAVKKKEEVEGVSAGGLTLIVTHA